MPVDAHPVLAFVLGCLFSGGVGIIIGSYLTFRLVKWHPLPMGEDPAAEEAQPYAEFQSVDPRRAPEDQPPTLRYFQSRRETRIRP